MDALVFDARMGASGDMLLGATLALGVDQAVLEPIEASIDVVYNVESVTKNGIASTGVTVEDISGEPIEGTDAHRSLAEVKSIVNSIEIDDCVKRQANAVFERLARAEGNVHGTAPEETHFHEVGADDAIADIVGTLVCIESLAIDEILTTPVATGSGTVEMAHGTYSVPPPAVLELATAARWPVTSGPVEGELLTPTGAALLAELADGVSSIPPLRVEDIGYGAGKRSFPDRPNVLRAIHGSLNEPIDQEPIRELETTVDDVTPEILGHLQKRLKEEGALDVSIVPLTMKKSRPGHLIKVICAPEDAQILAKTLVEETGTLGVRDTGTRHRWRANRHFDSVTLPVDDTEYDISIKVATDTDGTVLDVSPEFDDLVAIANSTDSPVQRLQERAIRAFYESWDDSDRL